MLSKPTRSSWSGRVELGVAGAVLTLLLFGWAFVRLWRVPRADGVTALGAAAVAVVGVHGCIDYVLHTPAVLLGAAALLGTALLPSARGDVGVSAVRTLSKAAVLPFGLPARRSAGDVVILLYHRVGDGTGRDRVVGQPR